MHGSPGGVDGYGSCNVGAGLSGSGHPLFGGKPRTLASEHKETVSRNLGVLWKSILL